MAPILRLFRSVVTLRVLGCRGVLDRLWVSFPRCEEILPISNFARHVRDRYQQTEGAKAHMSALKTRPCQTKYTDSTEHRHQAAARWRSRRSAASGFVLSIALSMAFCGSTFAQDSPVPDAPDESAADPLANEPGAESRVAKDASRLSQLVGGEAGERVDALVNTLFDVSKSDEERLAAANETMEIARVMDQSNPALRSAYRQLSRRVRLVKTTLAAVEGLPADSEARQLAESLAIRASVDFENSTGDVHAAVARRDYSALKNQYPEILAQIRPVIMQEYFNYNIHMVLSEPMLSRLVADSRSETGGVADCILGAWVTGCQVTDTDVTADIKPSRGTAQFNLVVNGRTVSDTQGRKSPATIYTRGNHRFTITKPTYFDGQTFGSGPARMDVNARNQTVGISTDFDRIPIIRGIARNIAAREVAEKKAQAEAIAARKLADEGLPRFETEVSAKFAEANSTMQDKILRNLRDKGVAPSSFSARSSETHWALSSRTMPPGTLGGTPPPFTPVPSRGIAVQIHESALNAAIASLEISGQLTIDEVIGRIEAALSDFLDRPVKLRKEGETSDDKTEFIFTKQDGIRIRFDEGRAIILLRTGFFLPEKERTISKHGFEIPIGIELEGGQLVLTPPATDAKGILSLRPQAIEGRSSLRAVAQARGIAKGLIDKTFKEPVIRIDPDVMIKTGDGSNIRLTLSQLELTDGWLTVVFE